MSLSALTAELRALQARLTELEDERAILSVLTRYGNYADSRRDDDWIALWAEDAVLEIELGPDAPVYGDRRRWSGHDGLRTFISNPEAHHRAGFYGSSLHLHGNNSAIRLVGESAIATTYALLLHNDDGEIRIVSAGVCSWRFDKRAGRWLIGECRRRRVGAVDTEAILRATE